MTTKILSTIFLLEELRDEHMVNRYQNVTLNCQDGSINCCGMILAAISPMVRSLGTLWHDAEEIVFCLPDFSVQQMEAFVTTLLSRAGPQNPFENYQFHEVMSVLGKIPEDFKLKEESNKINGDFGNDSYLDTIDSLLDWDDAPFTPSSHHEEEGEEPDREPKKASKRTNFDSVSEEARDCYDTKLALYICPKCGTERKNTRSMQQHLTWHQKYPNEDFHTSHICKICGKICADHSLLRAHSRLVHSPRTFVCPEDQCAKSFKSKEGLKQHLLVHSGVKNFICSQCGYAVRTRHHLKLHILKKHTEMKKTIPCEVCGKLFRHISNLKCHFYTHKARLEREHRCEPCGLTFRTQKSLDSHMALHDQSRPFKCSKCDLRYKNKDALVAHENTHQNHQYKCEFCDISYTRKDNLKRHVKEKHSSNKT